MRLVGVKFFFDEISSSGKNCQFNEGGCQDAPVMPPIIGVSDAPHDVGVQPTTVNQLQALISIHLQCLMKGGFHGGIRHPPHNASHDRGCK